VAPIYKNKKLKFCILFKKSYSKHIKNGNYKEAKQQVADLGKMAVIGFVWILPAGAVISGFIMKFSDKMRPTAFQKEENVDKI